MHRRGFRNLAGAAAGGLAVVLYLVGKFVDAVAPIAWLTVVVLALVAGVLWLMDSAAAARQRREFLEFAQLHGWTFDGASRTYTGRFSRFPFGGLPASRQENRLSGTLNGVECATFTHLRVATDAEGRESTEPFQITLVELPVVLPVLELVPETMAERFAKSLGGGDLDVESYEFNRTWRVLCRDPRYAHAVLDPRMVERLLQPDARELAIRIEGGAVMAWQPGRVGTDTLARRLGVLTAVARRIPEHVVREYRERGALNVAGEDRAISPTAPTWATTPGALTSGKATGIEPGPPATGEGFQGLTDGTDGFDIFNALTFRWP